MEQGRKTLPYLLFIKILRWLNPICSKWWLFIMVAAQINVTFSDIFNNLIIPVYWTIYYLSIQTWNG